MLREKRKLIAFCRRVKGRESEEMNRLRRATRRRKRLGKKKGDPYQQQQQRQKHDDVDIDDKR